MIIVVTDGLLLAGTAITLTPLGRVIFLYFIGYIDYPRVLLLSNEKPRWSEVPKDSATAARMYELPSPQNDVLGFPSSDRHLIL
jgi:hypothetical protein